MPKRLHPGLFFFFFIFISTLLDGTTRRQVDALRAEVATRRRRGLKGDCGGDETEAKGDEELPTRLSINFRRRLRRTPLQNTLNTLRLSACEFTANVQ